MKLLRKIVVTILLLIGGLILAALLIEHFYGDRIRAGVIERVNQHLTAEVKAGDVELSILRKFPYASVRLSDVELQEKGTEQDTLFHFGEVFLQFQLFDLFRENQRIERISFEDGELFLTIDRNGEHGLDIWKEEEGTETDTAATRFELERVEWQNVRFHYEDLRSDLRFRTELSYAFLHAQFDQDRSRLRFRADGIWEDLNSSEQAWEELDKPYSIEAEGIVEQNKERIRIGKSELTWDALDINSKGEILYGEENAHIDLEFETSFQELNDYIEAWPNPLAGNNDYNFDGEIRVDGGLSGPMGDRGNPVLESELEIRYGSIQEQNNGIRAKELEGEARFSSEGEKGNPELTVDELIFHLGGGEWKSRGAWEGGRYPNIVLGVEGESPVSETVQFLGIDTLREANGQWNASVRIRGPIPSGMEWGKADLQRLSIDGQAELKDATLAVKGNKNAFEELNGEFLLYDMNAKVVDFSGKVRNSDFKLNGRFQDLLPYLLLPEQKLVVHSELHSERIDLDPLLTSEEDASSEEYQLEFPDHVHLSLNTRIGRLSFQEFKAEKINGKLEFGPGGFRANGLSLDLADGSLTGGMRISAGSNPYRARASANLTGIDIRAFFRNFDSFGQELLQPEHLKGKMNARISYASHLEKDLSIPAASVSSSSELRIQKGELIRFQPLLDLGDELTNKRALNRFLELEELRDRLETVRFAELKNELRIENETLIIPRFDVNSSAIDITASGRHGFDGTIDYRFSLLLDELLSKPKESEFGYLKDEGSKRRLFVRMNGHVDDPNVQMDREAAREHREERREDEKKNIREALREEFGLFKKDSTESQKEETEEEASPEFEVKWGSDSDEEEKQEMEAKKDSSKSLWERLGIGEGKKDDDDER